MDVKTVIEILEISPASVTRYAREIGCKSVRTTMSYRLEITEDELLRIADRMDAVHKEHKKRKLAENYINNGSTIMLEDQKQKEHPLVTDKRMFITSWFPPIDSYEFLTECNTVKRSKDCEF